MNIRELIRFDIEVSIKKAGYEAVIPIEVSYPNDLALGDYFTSWPLQVAANFNQSPIEIAKKIQGSLSNSEVYESPVIAEPGFLNFHLRKEFLIKHLRLVLAEGDKFGSSSVGKGQTILVEYSSPNIAKPMHAGQLRNTNLGQAIDNMLSFQGYQTISDNHIGDWGTQFGALLYAYKSWGKDLTQPTLGQLLDLYVRFHKESASNPGLKDVAREEFRQLEQGNRGNRELWEKFRQITLHDLEGIYRELGAKFDVTLGESFYEKDLPKIVDQALGSGAAKRDPDSSVVIPLEESGLQPFLILKSDGATLYGTRDLATAKYRQLLIETTERLGELKSISAEIVGIIAFRSKRRYLGESN